MRAFRPSRFTLPDECDEDAERARLENVEVYAARAKAGLPLFDKDLLREDVESRNAKSAGRR